MAEGGAAIDETGVLRRDAGGFYLQRDRGGILRLELARTPVDLVEKRVRVIGQQRAAGVAEAEGVQPA